MTSYRVLPGKEWFTLAKVYVAGETVELSENEAAPFVGSIFESDEVKPTDPVVITDETTSEPPVEVKSKKR